MNLWLTILYKLGEIPDFYNTANVLRLLRVSIVVILTERNELFVASSGEFIDIDRRSMYLILLLDLFALREI